MSIMAVHQTTGRILASDGKVLGEGRAYLHLTRPSNEAQSVRGTLSMDWWDREAPAPSVLELAEGPRLVLKLTSDRLSGCTSGRILRYEADWPGVSGR